MNNLALIAAIGKNNELGLNNNLVFSFKEDLKFFKETTLNHPIIMGRKTYDSIGKLLPNRINIIITHDLNYYIPGAIIFHSKEEVLNYVKNSDKLCFIIGGASVYKEYIDDAKYLFLTEVYKSCQADTFFPSFDKNHYNVELIKTNKVNDIEFNFVKYTKK